MNGLHSPLSEMKFVGLNVCMSKVKRNKHYLHAMHATLLYKQIPVLQMMKNTLTPFSPLLADPH